MSEVHVARDNQLIAESIAHAQAVVEDATAGLQWFQPKLEGVVGKKLLEHMFMERQLCYKTKVKDLYAPHAYLDVSMLPGNMEIIHFKTAPDLTKRSIMGDYVGNGDTMNLASSKLNHTGYIQHHCGLVNTKEKVCKLHNQL
jgi:hypothetical protein